MTEQSFSNEWASREPVEPWAKLYLKPQDFPFLDQIGGHDDGIILRAQSLTETLKAGAIGASLAGERFTISLPNTAEMADALEAWIEIQSVLMPAARFGREESEAGLTMVIDDLPPAFQQVLKDTYNEFL
jgi:hypothetical protein